MKKPIQVPKVGAKKALERLRGLIAFFADTVRQYPQAQSYQDTLCALQREEANLVNKIGRK